jgi:hypothetical protein
VFFVDLEHLLEHCRGLLVVIFLQQQFAQRDARVQVGGILAAGLVEQLYRVLE